MQIKAFAQYTNLSTKTIRYYEEIGLLPPPKRLDNDYRDYDETDVARARFVAGARRLDFSIDDIRPKFGIRVKRGHIQRELANASGHFGTQKGLVWL